MKTRTSKIYPITITLILLALPLFYLLPLQWFLSESFNDQGELFLFMLYAGPMWGVFSLIVGVELYRRHVLQRSYGVSFLLFMLGGGCLVTLSAIIISPVELSIFTHDALLLTCLSLPITVLSALVLSNLSSQ